MTRPYVSAAARLLDREMPSEYLTEWTEIISTKPRDIEERPTSVVVFRIGSEWLALPADAFQEIVEVGSVHTLPNNRSRTLNGLVNVRGELLLCVAMDVLLGLEKSPIDAHQRKASAKERLLICNFKDERVAFIANEVAGTHAYRLKDVRNIPATLAKAERCTSGIVYWKDRAIGCLDVELLFRALNKGFK